MNDFLIPNHLGSLGQRVNTPHWCDNTYRLGKPIGAVTSECAVILYLVQVNVQTYAPGGTDEHVELIHTGKQLHQQTGFTHLSRQVLRKFDEKYSQKYGKYYVQ